MKKIFALFVAVAALMVWALPATAGVDFGGQYRIRGEQKSNTDFAGNNVSASTADKDRLGFYGQRVRLWGVAKPTNDTTIKITIQDSRTWGMNEKNSTDGPGLTDAGGANTLDLHESYVLIDEFFGTPLSLKIGRQELVYGDQRLVGAFGWSNNGRSFDAGKVMYRSDKVDVDLVVSKVRDDNAVSATAKNHNDKDFYILHGTVKTIPNNSLDLYVMSLRDDGSTALLSNNTAAVTANETQKLDTYGARLKGAVAGVDYTAEYVIQRGEINTSGTDYDVDANAYAVTLGYTIPGGPMGLRFGAEYAYASGDDNASDNNIETFSNLFPTNHGHYGDADQQGWRNMKAWNVNASIKPNAKTSVKLSYWDFTLAEDKDGWYGAGAWNGSVSGVRSGTCLDANGSQCDDSVGQELDLSVKYKYNSAVTIMAGVSRFFAGDRIEDYYQGTTYGGSTSNDTEDLDYAWVQLTANF